MRTTLGLALILFAAGCARSGPETFHVSGMVTYQDQPLPAGVIYFDPDVTKGHDGPQGFARIKDGKFDTRIPPAKPVTAGPHIVRISGFNGKPQNELPLGLPIFPEYSLKLEMPREDSEHTLTVPSAK